MSKRTAQFRYILEGIETGRLMHYQGRFESEVEFGERDSMGMLLEMDCSNNIPDGYCGTARCIAGWHKFLSTPDWSDDPVNEDARVRCNFLTYEDLLQEDWDLTTDVLVAIIDEDATIQEEWELLREMELQDSHLPEFTGKPYIQG